MPEILIGLALATVGYKLSKTKRKINSSKQGSKQKKNLDDMYQEQENRAKDKYDKSKHPERTGVIPNFYNQLDSRVESSISELDTADDVHDLDIFTNYGPNNFRSVTTTVGSSLDHLIDTNADGVQSDSKPPESFTEHFNQQFEEPSMHNGEVKENGEEGNYSDIQKDMTYNVNKFNSSGLAPFYSGSSRGYGVDLNHQKVERFSGNDSDSFKRKQVQKPFFDPTPQINRISQVQASTEQFADRFITNVSQERRNELLKDPERITPGVGLGAYGKMPLGFKSNERILPPTVDDMRVENKQKESYEGRIIDGLKYEKRGIQADVIKYRPQTFKETTKDDLQKTITDVKKVKVYDGYEAKETDRESTLFEHKGHAHNSEISKGKADENYREASKENYLMPEVGRVQATGQQKVSIGAITQGLTDNNVESWSFHTTNRESTGSIQHLTNVGGNGNVKSYAEQQDLAKETGRETLEQKNFPVFGSIFSKNTANLTDVAKSTIKETTIDQKQNPNILGDLKSYTELTDIAKQTIKETTLEQKEGQMKTDVGKHKVFNPTDLLRETIKETTLEQKEGQMKTDVGKHKVFNPTDLLRETIKETTLEQKGGQMKTDVGKHKVFNPADLLRETIKETTLEQKEGQMKTNVGKHKTFNPFDLLKETIKETTIDTHSIGGVNYGTTNKHNTGYIVTESGMDAKDTARQVTVLKNLHGGAFASGATKITSYEGPYNAETNVTKEMSLVSREPTKVSYSVIPKVEDVHIRNTHSTLFERTNYPTSNQISETAENRIGDQTYKQNKYVQPEVRLNPDLLKSLKTNEYTFLYKYDF